MKKSISRFSFLVLLFLTQTVYAQKLFVEFGHGGFGMAEMKSFQQEIQNQLEFDARIIENFPAYYTVKGSLLFVDFEDVTIGFTGGTMSTGGRVSYGDFSGSYRADSELSATYFGLIGEHIFLKRNNLELTVNASPYINTSTLDFSTEFIIQDNRQVQLLTFVSTSLGVESGFTARYYFGPMFVQAFFGGNFNIGGDLELKTDRDAVLIDGAGEIVKTNWSGYRANIGIGINFKRKQNEN